MNLAFVEKLLDGTGCARCHELDEFASGHVRWRFALAVLLDEGGLGDVDSFMFNVVPSNID